MQWNCRATNSLIARGLCCAAANVDGVRKRRRPCRAIGEASASKSMQSTLASPRSVLVKASARCQRSEHAGTTSPLPQRCWVALRLPRAGAALRCVSNPCPCARANSEGVSMPTQAVKT